MEEQNNRGLIASIVFAGMAIAGSVVFFALQSGVSDEEFAERINDGIKAYVAQQTGTAAPTEVDEEELVEDQPFIGDEDAPVTIVEFSDYLCGYCQLFHNESWEALKENYIETGKVKFVYRDFLLGYDGDYEAAMVADVRAIKKDEAFFAMHDHIFDTIAGGFDLENYVIYGEELGLDGDELKECFENEEFGDEILADGEYGRSLGVRGTPAFYVNDEFVSGAMAYEDLAALIDSKL